MWSFVTDFFHIACFQGSSMLQHASVLNSFLLLLYRGTTFCLSIYQLMGIWVGSIFLAIMSNAAIISVQVYLWTYVFSSLGYIHRIEIAGSHGNSIFNILRNFLPNCLHHCTILLGMNEGPDFSTSSPTLVVKDSNYVLTGFLSAGSVFF